MYYHVESLSIVSILSLFLSFLPFSFTLTPPPPFPSFHSLPLHLSSLPPSSPPLFPLLLISTSPPLHLSSPTPSPSPPFPQLYKTTVHNTVIEFIPLTMNAITLQPSLKARQAVSFNKEIYVDFVAVQIKFLSFLAYIIRIYQVTITCTVCMHVM